MRARPLLQGLGALGIAGSVVWLLTRASTGPRLGVGDPETRHPASVGAPLAPPTPDPSPAPAAPRSAPSRAQPLDEPALMVELRRSKDQNPALAEQLAREGNRRYPNSAQAPERASILIHALVNEGQPTAARGEAEDMVNRYPNSEWVREIEAFTGAHRHGTVHFTDAGQLAVD